MSAKLQELEARLAALEAEVVYLRTRVDGPPIDETPAERGERMLREAEFNQTRITAAWKQALREMGIEGEPPGIEKLRAMAEEERQQGRATKRRSAAGARAAAPKSPRAKGG